MYILRLKLNRLLLYKSSSSYFVISVLGVRVNKKANYDVFFIDFKKFFQTLERGSVQIRLNPITRRTLYRRLGLLTEI